MPSLLTKPPSCAGVALELHLLSHFDDDDNPDKPVAKVLGAMLPALLAPALVSLTLAAR
jgi:hypothetical protein